jgi:hypothetical protein
MSIKYKHRFVRLEPNPNKRVNIELKMAQSKVNSAGEAIVDNDGKVVKSLESVNDAVQLPGTVKFARAAITPSGLKTGLNILVSNPYKDETYYVPQWGEKLLKGKDKALLQHILEYKHNRDFNYYTNQLYDNITPSDKLAEVPFFQSQRAVVPLDGNVMFLDLNNNLHEIWYYMLRAHRLVANSLADIKGNPDAIYYMVNEDEIENVKAENERKMNKAIAALEKIYEESNDAAIKLAKALENDDKDLTKPKAYTWLNDYFRRGDIEYSQFTKYLSLYEDAARRQEFFAAADLQKYIDSQLIRTRDNKYFWMKPETDSSPAQAFEWSTKEKVIHDFLIAPEYQAEIEILEQLYESRK